MNIKTIASFLLTGVVVACSSSSDKPTTESGESNELKQGDSCGGFVELLCPEGLECVDDPTDACDPAKGGKGCMGTCQEAKYDPCGGKSCGDSCKICPPGKVDCVETAVMKACNAQGKCDLDLEPVCSDGNDEDGGAATPCSGKSCGDSCTTCPAGQTCPAVVETCNAKGECSTDTPECK